MLYKSLSFTGKANQRTIQKEYLVINQASSIVFALPQVLCIYLHI